MTHGHTIIPSRGFCIYCGKRDVPLTDEHVVPLSLGGQHILDDASSHSCADITKKFEQDVARGLWGDARISYNAPSRRKKDRKTHIVLTDAHNPSHKVKVPYSEYPAAMLFYKMHRAGLLEGMPDTLDMSTGWQLVAIHDDSKAKTFEERFGIPLTSKARHVPESFARLLAKIGYCNLLCALEPSDFRPICLPYIMGARANPSFIVGGNFKISEPEPDKGYVLRTTGFSSDDRLMLMAEIRLWSNEHTPTYHVVVGDVVGRDRMATVLNKIGPIEVSEMRSTATAIAPHLATDSHWTPTIWPLPFWIGAV